MTAEQLLVALGEIDESLPEVCEKTFPKKTIPVKEILAAAACVALVLLSTVAITHRRSRPPVQSSETTAAGVAEIQTEPATGESVTYPASEGATAVDILDELPQTTPPTATKRAEIPVNNAAQPQTDASVCVPNTTKNAASKSGSGASESYTAESAEVRGKPLTTAAVSRPFDNAPVTSKYPDLTYNGKHYTSRGNSDLRGKVGQSLGSVTLSGTDGDHDYTTTAELFSIPGISADAAVAVLFPDGGCYAYVSPQYRPATLGQLMDDLSLQSNMTFGQVHGSSGKYAATIYPAVPDSEVRQMLFDRSAKLDDREVYREETVLIDVRLPLLGYPAGHIRLTADGYLIFPLLESEKVYCIGRERAEAFLAYLDRMEGATKLAETTATSAPAVPKGGIETTVQTTKQN